jgi:hypothetical protein
MRKGEIAHGSAIAARIARRWGADALSEVPDEASDLLVSPIASSFPNGDSVFFVVGDERGHPSRTFASQVLVPRFDQTRRDAVPTKVGKHRQAVHVAPPAVPGGDQRADDLAVVLGHQEGVVGVRDQSGDRAHVIGSDGSGTAACSHTSRTAGMSAAVAGRIAVSFTSLASHVGDESLRL